MQFTGSPIPRQLLLAAALFTSLSLPPSGYASDAIYLLYRHWQPYDWSGDTPPADDVARAQRGLGWRHTLTTGDVSLDYDYQPLRIRTGEPAHNGHLHRVTVGGEWLTGLYRVQARLGLAGTSNMFIKQNFHRQVVNGRVAVFRSAHPDSPLSLGVGGDHRFGSFRWLPRVRWERANEHGYWLVDLPVLLFWRSKSQLWELKLERNGDRWATLDERAAVESALHLQEWRAELTYRINTARRWRPGLRVGLGVSIDTQVEYRDLNTGTADLRLGDAMFGSIRFCW